MRLGPVVKPQNALPAFAVTNQVEVRMGQEFPDRLSNRRQILFDRILPVYALDTKIYSRLCAENAMADGVLKKTVQFV